MRLLLPFTLFLATLFSGCQMVPKKVYRVGVDPSFYPSPLGAEANQVYGFTQDLLQAIAKVQHIHIDILQLGAEGTFAGLQQKKYEAFVSSFRPQLADTKWYDISDSFLCIGPVLIVPCSSTIDSLDQLDSKIVGAIVNSDGYYLAQKNPFAVVDGFFNAPTMLEALTQGEIDAAILEILQAKAFVQNIYTRVLKINSDPLTDEGLHLVALKGDEEGFLREFNKGLDKIARKGIYDHLKVKWGL